jgi:RNA-binding protein 5/10
MLRDETAIPSSINLGAVEGAFVKYWDDSAMVAVLEFKVEAPPQPQVEASTGPTKEKKEKKKKGAPADCSFLSHQLTGKSIDDASNKPPAPSALPISGKPVTLSFNKGGPGSKQITSLSGPEAPAQTSLGFSAENFAAEDDDAEATTSAEDNKGSFICSRPLSEYELTFGSDCVENGCSAHRKQKVRLWCLKIVIS